MGSWFSTHGILVLVSGSVFFLIPSEVDKNWAKRKQIILLCFRRRSPSPYYRGAYRSRSRSRSYSPRESSSWTVSLSHSTGCSVLVFCVMTLFCLTGRYWTSLLSPSSSQAQTGNVSEWYDWFQNRSSFLRWSSHFCLLMHMTSKCILRSVVKRCHLTWLKLSPHVFNFRCLGNIRQK